MLTFRDITAADRDIVIPMVEDFYRSDAVDHPVPTTIMERSFAAVVDPDEPLLRGVLVYEDGEPAGYVYLTFCYSAEVGGRCVFIEEIFLKEAFRGRGLARELVQLCEKWARERGCGEFASDCELSNTESLLFHLKLGFLEANRIICFTKKLQ